MNKKELICCVTGVLKSGNIRKSITIPPQEFRVSDQYGNSEIFKISGRRRDVLYSQDDVQDIVNAVLCVIEESLKRGEEISIKGFGSLGLHYRAARRTREPNSGKWCDVEARYVPKFRYGEDLRQIAMQYSGHQSVECPTKFDTASIQQEVSVDVSSDAIRIANIAEEVSFEEFFFRITGERLDGIGGVNGD